jgi:hypothetical protein
MSEQRRRASWIVILGCMLACGHSAMPSVAGGADDGFMLYAPSGKQWGLLVVRALTETKGDTVSATLELVRTAHLGFPASNIAAHPTLPLVYFSEEQGLGVSAYKRVEDGRLTLWRRSRAVPADVPASGVSSSALVITPDGRHVYAGIRGPDEATNAIACYAVGDDGSLTRAATLPWDGQIPDVIAR